MHTKQYLYKHTNIYINIRIWIGVVILYQQCGLLYICTIYELQNEKEYFFHYNEFVHIQHFEIVFSKIVYALLVFVFLDNIISLFKIDYYKFLLSKTLTENIWT